MRSRRAWISGVLGVALLAGAATAVVVTAVAQDNRRTDGARPNESLVATIPGVMTVGEDVGSTRVVTWSVSHPGGRLASADGEGEQLAESDYPLQPRRVIRVVSATLTGDFSGCTDFGAVQVLFQRGSDPGTVGAVMAEWSLYGARPSRAPATFMSTQTWDPDGSVEPPALSVRGTCVGAEERLQMPSFQLTFQFTQTKGLSSSSD